ncbi:MAG: MATE family efflux transporter, partial [Candidatus Atribacteria bacterium]
HLADTFWLGHLPPTESGEAVAGLQISWPIIWFLIALSFGFGIAGVALISQYTGAGEKKNTNLVASQMLSLSIIFGLIIAIFGFILTPYLVPLITQSATVTRTAITYMQFIFWGIPFIFIVFTFQSILSAKGDTITPMYINLFTVTLNLILDPFLIFGWWRFPHLGVVGAALATVICQGIAASISLYLLFKGTKGIRITLNGLIPAWKWLKKIFKIGLPAAIGHSTTAFGFVLVMAIIGRTNNPETVIAAYGVGDKLINIIFIVVDGLGTGIMTLIGQNLGANLIGRAKEIAKKSLQAAFLITFLEAALVFALRIPLFKLFIPDRPDIIAEGIHFLTIFTLGMPFFGLTGAMMAIFRGSGHNVQPMIVDMVRLWGLRIPFAYFLGNQFGATGIWWAMALSNIITAIVALYFYFQGGWKKQVIHEYKEIIQPTTPSFIPEEG